MKLTLFFSTMLLGLSTTSFAWVADTAVDLLYSGQGQWKTSDGQSGTYTVERSYQPSGSASFLVDHSYRTNGIVYRLAWTATFADAIDGRSLFTVTHEGRQVGSGYCFNFDCHYSFRTAEISGEETVTFKGTTVRHLGSSTFDGKTYYWQENLND